MSWRHRMVGRMELGALVAVKHFSEEKAKLPRGERQELGELVKKLKYTSSRLGGMGAMLGWLHGFHRWSDAVDANPFLAPLVSDWDKKRDGKLDEEPFQKWHDEVYPYRRKKPLPRTLVICLPVVGQFVPPQMPGSVFSYMAAMAIMTQTSAFLKAVRGGGM